MLTPELAIDTGVFALLYMIRAPLFEPTGRQPSEGTKAFLRALAAELARSARACGHGAGDA